MPADPDLASTTTTPGVGMTPGPVQPPAQPAAATPSMGAAPFDPTGGFPDWSKPSAKYEPYLPEAPRRPGLWGKDGDVLTAARGWAGTGPAPGPYMPQAQDIKQLLNDSLGGLSKIGSPGIMQLAMGLRGLNANVVNAFITGKMNRMKLEDAMFQRQMQQLILQQQGESEDYGIAFELYDKTKDPAKLQAALQKVADKYGDHDGIKSAINRGDFAWVEKVQAARDHKLGNLQKYVEQRDRIKATEDAQKREDEYLAGGAPSAPAAPAAAGAPGAAAAPVATPSAAAPGVTAPGTTAAPPKTLSPIENDANEFEMDTSKIPLGAPNTQAVARALAERAQAKDRQFDAIPQSVAPPGESDEARVAREKAVIEQGRRINPKVANAAQGILDGIETPTATASTKEGERLALALAHKARPEFDRTAAQINTRKRIMIEQAKIQGYQPAIRAFQTSVSNMRSSLDRNLKDLDLVIDLANKVNRTGIPAFQRWVNAGRKAIAGDREVTQLDTAMKSIQRDAGGILTTLNGSGRGQYTVYAQNAMRELIDPAATPDQISGLAETFKREYRNIIVPTVDELNRLREEAYGKGNFTPENADAILKLLEEEDWKPVGGWTGGTKVKK